MNQVAMSRKKFILAGPSFVIPGGIQDNVMVLRDLVSEVGLTFFETRSCLDYTQEDVPVKLAGLGLKFHVHLPLDLDWSKGAGEVFQVVLSLIGKAEHLSPDKFVLHPPASAGQLSDFARLWERSSYRPEQLLLENINGCDLSRHRETIDNAGLGICLDMGHVMAYDQWNLIHEMDIWERISLVHVYGREDHTGHVGLTALGQDGKRLLQLILSRVKENTSVLLELFKLDDFLDSRSILIQTADSWGMEFV